MAVVQDVGLGYCTGRGPASDLGPRNRVPVGAANESAAPASADAVSASCRVKPSEARRVLACTCAERGAQPGRRCTRRTSRPAKRHSWYHGHLRLAPIKVKRRVLIIVGAILTGAPMPIPVGSLVATTRATIAVGESLLSGSSDGYERLLGITARLVYAQGSSFSSWKVTGRWADDCKDMGKYGI